MLSLGSLAFLSPWILSALVLLPVLWWLLRVTPPAPRRIGFPAIRLLFGLHPKEETPAHTPLWLLLLRLAVAALVILALAHPLLNPGARLTGNGPVTLVIDDGWAAAPSWPRQSEAAADILAQAEREQRPVMVLTTAPPVSGEPLKAGRLMPAGDAREIVAALQPKPWASDRTAAMQALGEQQPAESGEVIWLADGLDDGGAAATLAERLQWFGTVRVLHPPVGELAQALRPPTSDGTGLKARLLRPGPAGQATVWVRASADQGRYLAREPAVFDAGADSAEVSFDLPAELRNRVSRIDIEQQPSAGAVVLVDERWRRRPVGLVSGSAIEADQPLLSDLYYLERALAPFAEVRNGTIGDLLNRELAVLILSDIGQVVGNERQRLAEWLERGGTLVRFAGPRLAQSADDLIPVRLRGGGRALGGALSWEQPAQLAPFAETSPFYGLRIPDDVTVNRQVLAEPAIDLGERTWARLADGTPLVTAERRGDGQLVLFHTTANTQWSNLPISGLFVEMLQRIVELSQGVAAAEGDTMLPPLHLLDGFGRFSGPTAAAAPIKASDIPDAVAGPRHPPGFYGTGEARRAINLGAAVTRLVPLGDMPGDVTVSELSASREIDLLPWLLTAALLLGIADLIAALALRGLLLPARRRGTAAVLAGLMVLAGAGTARAQPSNADDYALAASLDFRLAYVLTGDRTVDEMSRAGLVGLTDMLNRRTSVEGAEPLGVNLEQDEILFFPLLYWPIVATQPELSPAALSKLDTFMKTGGTVLFDTRDQDMGGGFGAGRVGPGTAKLRQILAKLDVPPLVPVPEDHILTKAFYLTQDFPGRWAGGQVWVERHAGGSNDGVSSLVIGGNDWAAAWAIDNQSRPLAAVVPGGPQQREMAYRFGINLVMYTLTGNYKADQVHVPALLERLGQ